MFRALGSEAVGGHARGLVHVQMWAMLFPRAVLSDASLCAVLPEAVLFLGGRSLLRQEPSV